MPRIQLTILQTRGYLTSQVTLTILVNLSQACCLRPHSLYQRTDKVEESFIKDGRWYIIFLWFESFRSVAKLVSHMTREVATKRHQGTFISEVRVFENSPNRKLDLNNKPTSAKCEFSSLVDFIETISKCLSYFCSWIANQQVVCSWKKV